MSVCVRWKCRLMLLVGTYKNCGCHDSPPRVSVIRIIVIESMNLFFYTISWALNFARFLRREPEDNLHVTKRDRGVVPNEQNQSHTESQLAVNYPVPTVYGMVLGTRRAGNNLQITQSIRQWDTITFIVS